MLVGRDGSRTSSGASVVRVARVADVLEADARDA